MKTTLFLIAFLSSSFIFCQSDVEASNFIDFQAFYGLENSKFNPSFTTEGLLWNVNNFNDKYGGIKMRYGRNWYVGKNEKKNTILQVSWIEFGLYNYGLIFNPLQLGIGKRISFGRYNSLEFVTNLGAFFFTDDYINPDIEGGFCWNFEFKYCLDDWKYGIHWQHFSTQSFQYIGLNIGRVL